MQRNLTVAITIAGSFVAISSSEASSNRNFPSYIPNGACTTCHNTPAGGANNLNVFGDQIAANLDANRFPDWSAVVDLDADSDGQTNGQELGDPNGTWMRGMPAPRRSDISQPADAASMSANPDGLDPEVMDDDEGGCSSTGARADGLTWMLLLMGFGALQFGRRRHRKVAVES